MLFEWALTGNIPVIGVQTDDPVNFTRALQLIAGGAPQRWSKSKTQRGSHQLFWTEDSEEVTREAYTACSNDGLQLVVPNYDRENPYIFDAGTMPTPVQMIEQYLHDMVPAAALPLFIEALKGLSLKASAEAVLITEARTGALTVAELRKTRSMLSGNTAGLTMVDTAYDFYLPPKALEEHIDINLPYFVNPSHPKLTPRGLLLAGDPGTGKTMAGKYVANRFGLPLYRLDLASVLTRYVGESEKQLGKVLAMVDRESPAILLLDEVEKVINVGEDAGVTKRILSQLLWWLAEHQSKVFTLMTTNDIDALPAELYRPGRLDKVIHFGSLDYHGSIDFAEKVLVSVLGACNDQQRGEVKEALWAMMKEHNWSFMTHAVVAEVVYTLTKINRWDQKIVVDKTLPEVLTSNL